MVRKTKNIKLTLNLDYLDEFLRKYDLDDREFAERVGIDYSQMWRIRNRTERTQPKTKEFGPGPEFIAGVMLAFPKLDIGELLVPVRTDQNPGLTEPDVVREVSPSREQAPRVRVRPPEDLKEEISKIMAQRGLSENAVTTYLIQRGLAVLKPTDVIPNPRKAKKSPHKPKSQD